MNCLIYDITLQGCIAKLGSVFKFYIFLVRETVCLSMFDSSVNVTLDCDFTSVRKPDLYITTLYTPYLYMRIPDLYMATLTHNIYTYVWHT